MLVDGRPGRLAALCISGGGIRSATFALGAIQGLAGHGVLDKFDYLSTVSGGGYIGGWLTAWIHNARLAFQRKPGAGDDPAASRAALDEVSRHLRGDGGPPSSLGSNPIQHLREYNNYLTPRLGLFSADTWTLIVTVARNMFLNWLVLLPIMLAVLMIPRLVLSVAHLATDIYYNAKLAEGILLWSGDGVALVLFAVSIVNGLCYLPGVGGREHTDRDFLLYCLSPLILASLWLTLASSWLYFPPPGRNPPAISLVPHSVLLSVNCMAAWGIYLLFFHKPAPPSQNGATAKRMSIGTVTLAMVLLGVGTGFSLWLAGAKILLPADWAVYITVGPPIMLSGFALAAWLFTGFTSGQLQDGDREWLSRAGAWLAMFLVIWLGVCGLVLLAPRLVFNWDAAIKDMAAAAGAISGAASAVVGYSAKSKATHEQSGGEQSSLPARVLVKLAAPLFVAALLVGLAVLTNFLVGGTGHLIQSLSWPWLTDALAAAAGTPVPPFADLGNSMTDHEKFLEAEPWLLVAMVGAVLLGFGMLMARFINVNVFSLHAMYRNRLIRAYLGASNRKVESASFTGFKPGDNIGMAELGAQRPFHILNLTLNLVSGKRLAWQQRKAESFTVSPLHSGSRALGYRPSGQYGSGISLGTAMTISGAAASPSMGYHSSHVIGFIMTMFNARLGCWLGNPGKHGSTAWRNAGPRSAAGSLAREAMGLTNDRSEYVYLSDGGHFENLALYEMVMRRCHLIVVIDSGCDPDYSYEDLGNALRKIRIDFGIEIAFEDASIRALDKRKSRSAVARIRYSAADGSCEDGHLLYIKPMLLGDEPPDVEAYHRGCPTFPHESTSDQWFNESQTESYRMLGLHTIQELCRGRRPGSLEDLCISSDEPAARAPASDA